MDNKEQKIIKKLYSTLVKNEWKRLVQDSYHLLEFNTTMRFLKKYLPQKGLILDAGGGPGRYTITLAKLGYEIILLDLVPEFLEFARKQIKKAGVKGKIKEIVEGSITDLSKFEDNFFDGVLCLGGPLSHVSPDIERKKAISELVRVAKVGAPIFVSVMSKYGVLLATPAGWLQEVALKNHFQRIVERGDDYKWRGNGYCHFFTANELKKLFLEEGVEVLNMIGLEGLNINKKETNRFAKKYPIAWKNWLRIHEVMCTDPFVVDASGHIMIIVRKGQKETGAKLDRAD